MLFCEDDWALKIPGIKKFFVARFEKLPAHKPISFYARRVAKSPLETKLSVKGGTVCQNIHLLRR